MSVFLKEQQQCWLPLGYYPGRRQPVLPELVLLEISKVLLKHCKLKHNCGLQCPKGDTFRTPLSHVGGHGRRVSTLVSVYFIHT